MKEHDLLLDGVREMFRYFYNALTQKKQIPTVTNVHRLILESPGTAQQSAMEYFSKRGAITSIVLACFGQAINSSTYLGDGESEMYDWEPRNPPNYRNDQEFVMARDMCIRRRRMVKCVD